MQQQQGGEGRRRHRTEKRQSELILVGTVNVGNSLDGTMQGHSSASNHAAYEAMMQPEQCQGKEQHHHWEADGAKCSEGKTTRATHRTMLSLGASNGSS